MQGIDLLQNGVIGIRRALPDPLHFRRRINDELLEPAAWLAEIFINTPLRPAVAPANGTHGFHELQKCTPILCADSVFENHQGRSLGGVEGGSDFEEGKHAIGKKRSNISQRKFPPEASSERQEQAASGEEQDGLDAPPLGEKPPPCRRERHGSL